MKDHEILAKVSKGDEAALDYLYKKHYQMMIKIVLNNNGTEQEAKDVYQDALIVFWQKALKGNLVLTSKISTYIYSICLNLWRKELDRKSRLIHEEHEVGEEVDYEIEERGRIIRQCIEELGDVCKRILTYYYFDGMNMNEIAERLEFANTDTAKTKKYKCKKRLDQMIKTRFSSMDFLD
ncbi:MAG: sigma-70 family RNA polymerase sigma factor [Bacteroidetes bacterium]|nr:sigma-70 family RNA polymerase sigma factor [Bacteroidota bacterium]MDA1119742.1 sigma-70 family RNA polymerase sigma factor [Bacteroidota bacterium]